jgi:hypothetical protein
VSREVICFESLGDEGGSSVCVFITGEGEGQNKGKQRGMSCPRHTGLNILRRKSTGNKTSYRSFFERQSDVSDPLCETI